MHTRERCVKTTSTVSISNMIIQDHPSVNIQGFQIKGNIVPQPRHTHLTVDLVLEGQRFLTFINCGLVGNNCLAWYYEKGHRCLVSLVRVGLW